MIGFFTTVLWFLIALTLLVAIHEYGHFQVARWCGVKVLRFSIGFGPRLLTKNDKDGTEFAFSLIPLGGYVKMLDEREGGVAPEEAYRAFNSKHPWQRIAILVAGPLANFILAVFLYMFIAMRGTYSFLPVVGEIEPGSIADRAGLRSGQVIEAVDGETISNQRALQLYLLGRLGEHSTIQFRTRDSLNADESSLSEPVLLDGWQRKSDNPDPLKGLGLSFYRPALINEVSLVSPDSPAEKAGILPGDRIIAINGKRYSEWAQWAEFVRANPGRGLQLEIERDDTLRLLDLTPASVKTDSGELIGRIGVSPKQEEWPESMVVKNPTNLAASFTKGFTETWEMSGFVLLSMKKLIIGEISPKNLSGPIGIAKVAGDSAKSGMWSFVSFLAMISVYLGVLNLLPIPILDGGHIIYCLVEWVKGSPVSEAAQIFAQQTGLVILFGLMALAIYNDIARLA